MSGFNEAQIEAQHNGSEFEKEIGASFEGYFREGVAHLSFMPVPTRPIFKSGMMQRVQTGKAPFDVYGAARRRFIKLKHVQGAELGVGGVDVAVMIGCELKATSEPKRSIAIVKPKGDSAGVEYHQLFALSTLAKMGGIARVVWNNGGQVGVLREEKIIYAFEVYEQSRLLEERGKGKGPHGSRSIAWEMFEPVNYERVGGVQCLHWLKLEDE